MESKKKKYDTSVWWAWNADYAKDYNVKGEPTAVKSIADMDIEHIKWVLERLFEHNGYFSESGTNNVPKDDAEWKRRLNAYTDLDEWRVSLIAELELRNSLGIYMDVVFA